MRGEEYESIKNMPNKKKQNSKPSKSKSKPRMHDSEENAIDIGLGSLSAEEVALKRKKELSLSMAERLQRKSEAQFMSETKRLKVRGHGTVKEVSFVPKSSRKRMGEKNSEPPTDDRVGRSRRGIKDLGFRTPFKHRK